MKGDVAFAETVLSTDCHFRHGNGWTQGERTGGTEDDRAVFLKRIADKEYLVLVTKVRAPTASQVVTRRFDAKLRYEGSRRGPMNGGSDRHSRQTKFLASSGSPWPT